MQTGPLSLAVTVASAVAKQLSGNSKINNANKDEAVADHTAAPSFKKTFKQALADTSAPQSERSIMSGAEKTAKEIEPVAVDPGLTGMLSPALQALIDSLPRPDNAASFTLPKAVAAGISAEPALVTPLPVSSDNSALSALAADAVTLAQSDITAGTATNTPRLQAAATNTTDATASTARPSFTLPDLAADASLPVTPTAAVQNLPAAEALFNTAALVAPTQTVSNPAASHIATRVGSPEWDKTFGQKIVWISKSSSEGISQSASLSLSPPELGPIKIVLQISDTQAYASFSSAQPEVRQAIESALPKLREMLGESGLQLAQADINSGNSQQQDDAASHQAQQSRQAAAARSANLRDAETQAGSVISVSISDSTSAGRALVDTFA